MPSGDWNHPGTKQGVYMMGPNGEYLEGGGAISGDAADVRRRLKTALDRWARLRKTRKYENAKVPLADAKAPPEYQDKPLVLRVFLRDLPRARGDKSGRRFTKADLRGMWLDFTKWAWNTNWIAFDDPGRFVTKNRKPVPIAQDTVLRICRNVLVDNVRGQTARWRPEHVKSASLTKRCTKTLNGKLHIEYTGKALMDSGSQKYDPTLYGQAVWNPKKKTFESFNLLAIGTRSGKGSFNQRSRDPGPAPMGITLVLPE